MFVFEDMRSSEVRVLKAIEESRAVSEAINDLAQTSDKALLSSMGIDVPVSESDSEAPSDQDANGVADLELPGTDVLLPILQAGKYNWFQVVDYIERETSTRVYESPVLGTHLQNMFSEINPTMPHLQLLRHKSMKIMLPHP